MPAGQVRSQQILDSVGVLVLIHEHIAKAPAIGIAHTRVAIEQLQGFEQQIIEVQSILICQTLGIDIPHLAKDLLVHARTIVDHKGLGLVRGLVFLVRNPTAHRRRAKAFRIKTKLLDDLLDQLISIRGVVDRKVPGEWRQVLDVPAQDARTHGVKGADPGALEVGQQTIYSLAHLFGSLVGEGDRQDLFRADPGLGHQPCDAMGHHPGLARAWSREDQQRPLRMNHRRSLGLIQTLQQLIRTDPRLGPRLGRLYIHPIHKPRSLTPTEG